MARSRTLKPEFWTDEVIVELSFVARLFYQGCWNFAICDQGHIDDSPKSLKMKIFPADDVDPAALIDELIKWRRLVRKETPDGRTYLHVGTLVKHTRMETRWKTRCPYCALEGLAKPVSAPPATDEHTETRAGFDEHDGTRENTDDIKERKGKEGKESSLGAASRAKPRHKLPDGFTVTPDMIVWAREHTPLVGQRDTDAFKDHWRGNGEVKADWVAAWRNWMRKAQTDAERYRSRASPPPPTDTPGHILFNPDDHD